MNDFTLHGASGRRIHSAIDTSINVYLNVGCWCAGRTDFAIVHHGEAYLCTWKNFLGDEEVKYWAIDYPLLASHKSHVTELSEVRSNRIREILDPAKAKERHGAPKILAGISLPMLSIKENRVFTAESDVLVFLGDLHLNLFRETLIDEFTVDREHLSERDKNRTVGGAGSAASQALFLNDLLDHLTLDCGLEAKHIIQCGDLFEVWHTQIVYDCAFNFLRRHERTNKGISFFDSHHNVSFVVEPKRFDNPQDLLVSLGYDSSEARQIRSWLIRSDVPRQNCLKPADAMLLMLNEFPRGVHLLPAIEELQRFGQADVPAVQFLDVKAVEAEIIRMYPELGDSLQSFLGRFTRIRGNHDTLAPNFYLGEKFGDATLSSTVKGRWEPEDKGTQEELQRFGLDGSIVCEHGHHFDPFNNDRNYFRKGAYDRWTSVTDTGGFVKTVDYLRDILQGKELWPFIKSTGANVMLPYYARHRKDWIFRLDDQVESQLETRLVVMGHTHRLEIEDRIGRGLAELPGGFRYCDQIALSPKRCITYTGQTHATDRRSTDDTEVDVYVIAWDNHCRIDWRDKNARAVAESALYSIWKWWRSMREDKIARTLTIETIIRLHFWKLGELKQSIGHVGEQTRQMIGHTALVVRIKRNGQILRPICISHTGGNPGRRIVLPFAGANYPAAWLNMFQVIATHVDDGRFEKPEKVYWRLNNNAPPRIQRISLKGVQADAVAEKVKGLDEPRYYGLNMNEIRVPLRWSCIKTIPRKPTGIVRGGCANAVATSLEHLDLAQHIPARAKFELKISFSAFCGIDLPIVFGEDAFNEEGRALDTDVQAALKGVPLSFDDGSDLVQVAFYDPSHWFDAMPLSEPKPDEKESPVPQEKLHGELKHHFAAWGFS